MRGEKFPNSTPPAFTTCFTNRMTLGTLQLGSYFYQTPSTHGARRPWRTVLIQSLGLNSRGLQFFLHEHTSANEPPKNLSITPQERTAFCPPVSSSILNITRANLRNSQTAPLVFRRHNLRTHISTSFLHKVVGQS